MANVKFSKISNDSLRIQKCTNCVTKFDDIIFACEICSDFKLCTQCYVCRVELGHHKASHAFKVIDLASFTLFDSEQKLENNADTTVHKSGSMPKLKAFHYNINQEGQIFVKPFEKDKAKSFQHRYTEKTLSPTWRIKDEIYLLDLIDRFGYGNWNTIAEELDHSMEGITAEEVANHYLVHYVLTDIGDDTFQWKYDLQRLANAFYPYEHKRTYFESMKNEDIQFELDNVSYMPKRNDFSVEFDEKAEEETIGKVLSQCNFENRARDNMIARCALLTLVTYNHRLAKRLQMKSIVRKYDLVEKFIKQRYQSQSSDQSITTSTTTKTLPYNKSPCKSRKQLSKSANTQQLAQPAEQSAESQQDHTNISAFSPFLRFCSPSQLQNLYLNLQREYALKVIIRKLLKYRCRGIFEIKEIKEDLRKRMKTNEGKSILKVNEFSSSDDDDDEEFSLDLSNLKKLLPNAFSYDQQIEKVVSAILDDLKVTEFDRQDNVHFKMESDSADH